jgi:hypothetical protein
VGRIRMEMEVEGKPRWTLFDSGARYSYITRDAAAGLHVVQLPKTRETALAGRKHSIEHVGLVLAELEGHHLEFQANVIDQIGTDEDGRNVEVLFGAIAMQLWGIKLDPPNERLDLTHFADDFVEF